MIITEIIIPNVVAPNPSTLKEIEEEIKKINQELEEADKLVMIDCQARLRELDKVEQRAKRDGIYGHLRKDIEQARKKVADDYNKYFGVQTSYQTSTRMSMGEQAKTKKNTCHIQ